MASRTLLLISLGLNLGWLGLLAWLSFSPPQRSPVSARTRVITNVITHIVSESVTSPTAAGSTQEVSSVSFHWSQVESPDYRKFAANLRGVGCPERTIREILLADVNEQFARRRKTIIDAAKPNFWRLMMTRNRPVDRQTEARLGTLLEERRVLLADLGIED